jgi:signal transduction histidine kinase
VMAGVLQGRRIAVTAAMLAALAVGWVAWRTGTSSLPPIPVPWPSELLVFLTIIFATAAFVDLAIGEIILNTQRAEASLRASRVADASNLAKTEFLAHVSHELRTPLNGILGFSEHLKSRITDPALRESASIIHSSGQHLLALVNSLLDLSQLESGQTSLALGWFQLRPLLQETAGLHGAAAAAKKLTFQLEVADNLPENLYSDATRLRQILNNLCHNAVKFTSSGGIVLSASPRENGIEFQVRDTGPGIDPRLLPHLFERFQQHDEFNSRLHGGAGLGLALSKEFTELLGGRIAVDSQPGQGSAFTIWLPSSEPSSARPS